MILGLFLDRLGIPIVPAAVMILAGLVLIGGFAFMIFRHIYEKGESDISPVLYEQISTIAGYVFVIYVLIEVIAGCACVCVNEACRNGYHYNLSKTGASGQICRFCSGFKINDLHSAASDCLMLGIYFDAFIVNAFVTNAIKVVRGKIAAFGKKS